MANGVHCGLPRREANKVGLKLAHNTISLCSRRHDLKRDGPIPSWPANRAVGESPRRESCTDCPFVPCREGKGEAGQTKFDGVGVWFRECAQPLDKMTHIVREQAWVDELPAVVDAFDPSLYEQQVAFVVTGAGVAWVVILEHPERKTIAPGRTKEWWRGRWRAGLRTPQHAESVEAGCGAKKAVRHAASRHRGGDRKCR